MGVNGNGDDGRMVLVLRGTYYCQSHSTARVARMHSVRVPWPLKNGQAWFALIAGNVQIRSLTFFLGRHERR